MPYQFIVILMVGLLLTPSAGSAASPARAESLKQLIQTLKEDSRGPYKAIRWFCPDGLVLPAREPCPEPGGIQHAAPKDEIVRLSEEEGIHLGQILAGMDRKTFWDTEHQHARLKQYILEKYLKRADDGWIHRRARFYRGAVQLEDETAWAKDFLTWLAGLQAPEIEQFYFLREAVRELPHDRSDDRWARIRQVSKEIADKAPAFQDLRVKLHGQPEKTDVATVKAFRTQNAADLPKALTAKLDTLIADLETAFSPLERRRLKSYLPRFGKNTPVRDLLETLLAADETDIRGQCRTMADLLLTIRERITPIKAASVRLALLKLSVDLETLLYKTITGWRAATIGDLLEKNRVLARAAAGCGFLELWEWLEIEPQLIPPPDASTLSADRFGHMAAAHRRLVEWGTGMVRAHYGPTVALFGAFEPMAGGFLDDRIRSSILLPMGDAAARLADAAAAFAGTANRLLDLADTGRARGLNPGFALGTLHVVTTSDARPASFDGGAVYALASVPPDLPPVGGLLVVSEGNLVSHVQLLARNLGIPNAVIAPDHLQALTAHDGQPVFYAVSPGGTVLVKPAEAMTPVEQALVEKRRRSEERVRIPLDKLDLATRNLLPMADLRAADSGKVCGPKAANLGQLKHLFPENVVDGIVIPFGVFRRHMDQPMPGAADPAQTYWQFLEETFRDADAARRAGTPAGSAEADVLARLATLREAMGRMPFLPGFREELQAMFRTQFGAAIGKVPVFIRSDTNMEDLPNFTGAGLNKTVFNVRDADAIWQGIREVWASPYRERGYLWRQKFMTNPENVYPSILILPTVTVDASGVLITQGVDNRDPDAVTVAFSRGPGGAVEGQAAETYLLPGDGAIQLLSPSREPKYNILPASGGVRKGFKYFHERILTPDALAQLREFANTVRRTFAALPGIESQGPFDVELGFKDGKIWLFQIRPYVESARAKASEYLGSLDPPDVPDKMVSLDAQP